MLVVPQQPSPFAGGCLIRRLAACHTLRTVSLTDQFGICVALQSKPNALFHPGCLADRHLALAGCLAVRLLLSLQQLLVLLWSAIFAPPITAWWCAPVVLCPLLPLACGVLVCAASRCCFLLALLACCLLWQAPRHAAHACSCTALVSHRRRRSV